MKIYNIFITSLLLLWGITLASFADEPEVKNTLWTTRLRTPRSNIISNSSARPPEDGYESYEYNVRNEAFCRVPEGSKVLLSVLVAADYGKYFTTKDDWDPTELRRYCHQPDQLLVITMNTQKRVFWVTMSIPNTNSSLCARTDLDEEILGGGSDVYYHPTSYFYPWYSLPELVVNPDYFILHYDRNIKKLAPPEEQEQMKQEKLAFIQSLPECQPNIRLKK